MGNDLRQAVVEAAIDFVNTLPEDDAYDGKLGRLEEAVQALLDSGASNAETFYSGVFNYGEDKYLVLDTSPHVYFTEDKLAVKFIKLYDEAAKWHVVGVPNSLVRDKGLIPAIEETLLRDDIVIETPKDFA